MSKEKIEEMTKTLLSNEILRLGNIDNYTTAAKVAEHLIVEKGYRKQSEMVSEIIDIINKRIETNNYHMQGNHTDLFHGIYTGRYEAYRDIAEIIEQKYGDKMKGGAE